MSSNDNKCVIMDFLLEMFALLRYLLTTINGNSKDMEAGRSVVYEYAKIVDLTADHPITHVLIRLLRCTNKYVDGEIDKKAYNDKCEKLFADLHSLTGVTDPNDCVVYDALASVITEIDECCVTGTAYNNFIVVVNNVVKHLSYTIANERRKEHSADEQLRMMHAHA